MSEKKYLDEEKYVKNKKKIKSIGILILVFGILVGGSLIATGIVKYNNKKMTDEKRESIQLEIDTYNEELASLKAREHQELLDNGMSEEYYRLGNQIDKFEDIVDELEDDLDPDLSYLVAFYVIGGFVLFASIMFSCSVFFVANGREIAAFSVQQSMPIAKEGMENMAPSVGKTAKEIAKGIKEGLDDEE